MAMGGLVAAMVGAAVTGRGIGLGLVVIIFNVGHFDVIIITIVTTASVYLVWLGALVSGSIIGGAVVGAAFGAARSVPVRGCRAAGSWPSVRRCQTADRSPNPNVDEDWRLKAAAGLDSVNGLKELGRRIPPAVVAEGEDLDK